MPTTELNLSLKRGFSEAGSFPKFLFHGMSATTQGLLKNCQWIKFIRHDCELKLKRTTINNQFAMLSFGSSQFVRCEVSVNRTHEKKMIPKKFQNYLAKVQKKTFPETRKSSRRASMAKNTKRAQKDPLCSEKL